MLVVTKMYTVSAYLKGQGLIKSLHEFTNCNGILLHLHLFVHLYFIPKTVKELCFSYQRDIIASVTEYSIFLEKFSYLLYVYVFHEHVAGTCKFNKYHFFDRKMASRRGEKIV